MGEAEIIGLTILVIVFFLMIIGAASKQENNESIKKQLAEFEPALDKIELEIQSLFFSVAPNTSSIVKFY